MALLHAARVLHEADEAKIMGIEFGAPRISIEKLRGWKDGVVKKLTGGVGQVAKFRKVSYIPGRGTFVDANTLRVDLNAGGTQTVSFDHCIVATGSRPATIPFFDAKSARVLDSTSALALMRVPETLLVVGGGYIGLELGSVYAALGARVWVVEMLPGLLMPGADRDLVAVLEKRVSKSLERIMVNTRVAGASEARDGARVMLEGAVNEEQTFDQVLVSVGRKPNTTGFGLENTKVIGFLPPRGSRRNSV